eukprot:1731311-Rhodomonas_salina.1
MRVDLPCQLWDAVDHGPELVAHGLRQDVRHARPVEVVDKRVELTREPILLIFVQHPERLLSRIPVRHQQQSFGVADSCHARGP